MGDRVTDRDYGCRDCGKGSQTQGKLLRLGTWSQTQGKLLRLGTWSQTQVMAVETGDMVTDTV